MALMHTPVCDFGQAARPFSLPDARGRVWSLDEVRGPKGVLVMFICNHCPYVKAIRDKLVRDTRELAALGIGSVGIMSNDVADYPEDAPEEMLRVADRCGFPFPYLIDERQDVARAYGAVCTPDFFGYNADLELQYRGRLDAAGARADATDEPRELFEAMKRVAETGQGPRQQTASMGCSIKWKSA
jgi:peroxiredoxin